MNEVRQSETVCGPSLDADESPVMQAAKVACAYIKSAQQGRRSKAFDVMNELAVETLKRAESGKPTEFTALNLQAGVAPDAAKEPSGWLSPLWNRLVRDEPQWAEGLVDTARQLGLGFIPKLAKTRGSPALYSLQPVPVPAQTTAVTDAPIPEGGLRYIPASVKAPGAWLGGALRNGILRWTLGVRITIAGTLALVSFAVIGLVWLGLTLGLRSTQPLTLSELLGIGLVAGLAWETIQVHRFLADLFDLRIVLAPSFITPLLEDNVTLELRHASADDDIGELAFVRYTATCPICEGNIFIDSGRTAFPDRLVGRCRRSAREHVFSFDPSTRIGRPLIR
jgi:hypothetical protein